MPSGDSTSTGGVINLAGIVYLRTIYVVPSAEPMVRMMAMAIRKPLMRRGLDVNVNTTNTTSETARSRGSIPAKSWSSMIESMPTLMHTPVRNE